MFAAGTNFGRLVQRDAFIEQNVVLHWLQTQQCTQPNLSKIFQTLAPTVQPSAVGLNYHIVVPCVNGIPFYFLVHCLCLYFHVNILFNSTANLIQAWLAGSSEIRTITTNPMGSKSSDFLGCFMSILHQSCHYSKLFSPHIS